MAGARDRCVLHCETNPSRPPRFGTGPEPKLYWAMASSTTSRGHVNDRWDAARASGLTPEELLVYRSNLLGADQRITNTGGGNTSAKLTELDPLTGDPVEVLWVKGSGGDLRTS